MILRILFAILFLIEIQVFPDIGSGNLFPDEFVGDFGQQRVGFRFIDLIDESRTYDYSGREGRPIRIYTWYPAETVKLSEPMTFGRYIDISRSDFHDGTKPVIISDRLPIARALSEEQLNAMATMATNAYENTLPAEGQFPLVLFGQGLYYENPITHFALCEYLASHGFVVATCPLTGTNSPIVMLTVRDLESIVRDLEFVLEYSRNQPYVKTDRTGVIGYDMGGMAAQILQARNTLIDAVMTLDAGIIFGHFSGLPADHPSFDLQRLTAPWLHITQTIFVDPYRQYLDQSAWGQVSCDRYLMLFQNVEHVNFTSYGLLNIPAPLPTYWGERALPNVPVYKAIGESGLTFLKAYLKEDQYALGRLTDMARNPSSEAVFTLENRHRIPPGLVLDQFLNQIIGGDIEKSVEQARLYKNEYPSWTFYPENTVNEIGYRFLYSLGRPEIALGIFKLNAEMYPQSCNVFDSYAEALLALGRVQEAIENYSKSLELDPKNLNAKKILEDLKNR